MRAVYGRIYWDITELEREADDRFFSFSKLRDTDGLFILASIYLRNVNATTSRILVVQDYQEKLEGEYDRKKGITVGESKRENV